MAFDVIESTLANNTTSSKSGRDLIVRTKRTWSIASTVAGLSSVAVRSALQASGELPIENFSAHPDNSLFKCTSCNVARKFPILFEASADYETPVIPAGTDQDEADYPWDLPTKRKTSSVLTEAETDEDINGKAIINPGTDEPVFGVNRTIVDTKVVLKRSFLVFGPSQIEVYAGGVNSDEFIGFPAGRGKITLLEADENDFEGTPYYDVICEILFRKPYRTTAARAWWHRRELRGYYAVKSDGTVGRAVDQQERKPVTQPVRLNSLGEQLDPGDPSEFVETPTDFTVSFGSMGFY